MAGAVARVLIVDDDEDAASILADLLQEEGHETVIAADGAAAVALATTWQPDCVVLDLSLPDMNGLDVARELRACRPCLRIVALSGYVRARDLEQSLVAGCDAYLTKPSPFEAILRALGHSSDD